MAESFLEEQLHRIRELTARISQAELRAAELSDAIARDREAPPQGPLDSVRDDRAQSSPARPSSRRRR